jgi:hypothetical protein
MGTNNFNINRLFLLLQRQLIVNKKNLLIAFAACFGTILFIYLLTIYTSGTVIYEPLVALSFVVIFTGGFIFTSIGFNELHAPDKAYQYLTLPATTLEKLLSVWLLTSIAYVSVSLVLTGVIALIGNMFAVVVGADTKSFSELLNFPILNLVWIYFIAQTVFLLGSCYFNKNNFLKTLLALFVLFLGLAFYAGLNGWIFFGSSGLNITREDSTLPVLYFMQHTLPILAKVVIGYLVGPFFLVTSYFVLKERQV